MGLLVLVRLVVRDPEHLEQHLDDVGRCAQQRAGVQAEAGESVPGGLDDRVACYSPWWTSSRRSLTGDQPLLVDAP